MAVPFGGESGVAQQALGEQLLVAVVTSSGMSVSMRARFWQIGLGRSSNSGIGGELVSQIAQTDYALFRHAEATSRERLGRSAGECKCTEMGVKVLVVRCRSKRAWLCPLNHVRGLAGPFPLGSLEVATHVQAKLGGWKVSNSNNEAAATITLTTTR